jgi:hypothetical protein
LAASSRRKPPSAASRRTTFIGLITLDYETFTVNADPGQTMFVFRADPGSSDEHSLLLLAAIAAGS